MSELFIDLYNFSSKLQNTSKTFFYLCADFNTAIRMSKTVLHNVYPRMTKMSCCGELLCEYPFYPTPIC